jgi:hypothetical protein
MSIVKVTDVRLAFPNLFEPDSKYERFGASFPIVPNSANAHALAAAIEEVAREKWGAKAPGILAQIKAKGDLGYQEASKRNGEGNVYDGFENCHTLNASTKARPQVIDRDTSPLTAVDGKPYAGCYVDASVEFWAQDNTYGKKINATLRWVQFRRDGAGFAGGAPVSQDEFAPILEGSDAESLV